MYNLCCISNELKDKHSFKTMTWKQFTSICKEDDFAQALNILGSRWLNNIKVTGEIIKYCAKNGWGYRVSSDLFPCLTHPEFNWTIEDVPQYDAIMDEFAAIARFNAAEIGQNVRLSCHPDQFNVLASTNDSAVNKTIKELECHGWTMDQLGCTRDYNCPMNIHVNCSQGNLQEIADRFMFNLNRCNDSVKYRLVIENEDKGVWHAENLHQYFDIPITFDNLHNKCLPCPNLSEYQAAMLCVSSWGNIKPIFHLAESHPEKNNPRSHADFPSCCPDIVLQLKNVDWDFEFKEKCYAIKKFTDIILEELTRESQELGLY